MNGFISKLSLRSKLLLGYSLTFLVSLVLGNLIIYTVIKNTISQAIGKTSYIYCVDSKGVLRVHPKINSADLSKYDFIRRQIKYKEGYLEYEWANPGEKTPRKKALYMTYFGPWDWIISVEVK